ncbi:MAG: heme-binding protein [Acidobacteriia bacterium]|nr:heme-binding protein [Terriglobia bacterium]
MITVPKLTLDDVKKIMEATESKARSIGVDLDIAIVDDGGHLLMFERMDSAKITSIQVSIDKAFTAAGARRPTHEYAAVAGAGGPAFGIHVSHQGRFSIVGGGVPIFVEGRIVGAVGCSSGTAEQDREVAEAGIQAFMRGLSQMG